MCGAHLDSTGQTSMADSALPPAMASGDREPAKPGPPDSEASVPHRRAIELAIWTWSRAYIKGVCVSLPVCLVLWQRPGNREENATHLAAAWVNQWQSPLFIQFLLATSR